MKLCDLILLYDLERVREVSIGLTRKTYDEIGSDIEPESIFSFHISKFFEDFSKLRAVVVTVHGFEYFRGS